MKVTITGATGLVGSNLAIECLKQGHEVKCTKRASSKTSHLKDFDIEWIEASLNDKKSLENAFRGSDVVFNCAALVSVRSKPTTALIDANVNGTYHVIEAIKNARVSRLIHCSSVVAMALSTNGSPVSEAQPWNFNQFGMDDGYAITKFKSQEIVLKESHLDCVVVNPTYMFGPYDCKPSSGRIILDIIKGKVPGHTPGYNNFVDVRDVVKGMLLACQHGRSGECYILGGENMSYQSIIEKIAYLAKVSAPKLSIPKWFAYILGYLGDIQEFVTNHEVKLNSKMVKYAFSQRFQFSSEKAKLELGYTTHSIDVAILDAIKWFKNNNMFEE